MKFLVVFPRFISYPGEFYYFPVGISYIVAILKKKNYEVHTLNLNYCSTTIQSILSKEIKDKGIDIFCTGGLTHDFNRVSLLIKTVKTIKPDILTVVGGGLISSEPSILEELNADFGIIGEGEETIIELAEALTRDKNIKDVNGLIYWENNNLVMTPPRQEIDDIDKLPFPDYDGFEINKYLDMSCPTDNHYYYISDKPRFLPIIASRSCPYKCTFCYHPCGKKYRQRSLDNIFMEIDYFYDKYRINALAIYDELFALNKERLYEFCQRIRKYNNLKWGAQLRVDMVDKDILTLMKESGCFQISYGLESASNEILKSMKKNTTIEQIEKALELTHSIGINIQGNFIFGDIIETQETINKTLTWWNNHREYQITLGTIIICPGSELYNKAIERGIIKDRKKFIKDGCPSVNLTKLTNEEYYNFSNSINDYRRNYFIVPKNIHMKNIGIHPLSKENIFKVKSTCPYCGKDFEYSNMKLSPYDYTVSACRNCNQRFYFPPLSPRWARIFSLHYIRLMTSRYGVLNAINIFMKKVFQKIKRTLFRN